MVQEWLLIHMITLYKSLSHTVMVFTVLLGNIFQQWIFLCFQTHVNAGWRSSHTKPPTLLSPLSQDSFMCPRWFSWCSLGMSPTENTASTSSPVVSWCHFCHADVFIVPSPSNGWRIWWHGITCSIVACKRVHRHVMSTEPPPSNPKQ
jgi:hypothetical protein